MNDFDKVATTSLDEWIEFLKTGKVNDNTKAAGLQEAREQLRVDSLPTKERRAYDRYMESVRHMRSLFDGKSLHLHLQLFTQCKMEAYIERDFYGFYSRTISLFFPCSILLSVG